MRAGAGWRGQVPPERLVTAWILVVLVAIAGPLLWRPGFLLINDSVAVPDQDLLPWMWGAGWAPPRAVPQDVVVAVLDEVLPAVLVQRLLVLGGVLILGLGVARLLSARPAFDRAAAATVAMWSTYVFERSQMGHWTVVIGLGALPWVLRAADDLRAGRPAALTRLVGWGILGSLVPTTGCLQVATAGVVLAWPGPRRARSAAAGVGALVAVQLVWLVPALAVEIPASAEAAELFGLRGQGRAGPVLTALGTGGIWNASAAAATREGFMSVLAPVLLAGLAALGAPRLRTVRTPVVGSLVVVGAAGLLWAVLTDIPAAAGWVQAIEALPGGGLLRDAQKWLAPWAVLLSLAAGLGMGRMRDWFAASDARGPVTVLLLLVPIMLLPDLALGSWGRLRPATYPPEWDQVREVLRTTDEPGDVVSLPWSSFRAYDWNGATTVLDPAPRYLPRVVVTDSRLLVAGPDGLAVVRSDDARSVAVGAALGAEDPAAALRDQGIGWVLWQEGQPGTPGYSSQLDPRLASAGVPVLRTPTLSLYRLDGDPRLQEPPRSPLLPVAWLVWLLALVMATASGVRNWYLRARRGARDDRSGSASLRATDGS